MTVAMSTVRRIRAERLAALAEQCDAIDWHLLSLLDVHRYATTRQLAQLVNLSQVYISARSALRQASRRLSRHRRLGLVDHLERRIGGVRAGSSGFVWYLTEPGHRLVVPRDTTRHRHNEPSRTFLAHTLAVTEARLVIERAAHDAGGHLSLLRTEPNCWRSWTGLGGARHWLKPDLEVITGTADGEEDHWLIEVDLGTENPARLLAKCHHYQNHLRTGTEQAQLGYYPQVLWVCNQPKRADWLREHIATDAELLDELFVVVGSEEELQQVVCEGRRGGMPIALPGKCRCHRATWGLTAAPAAPT